MKPRLKEGQVSCGFCRLPVVNIDSVYCAVAFIARFGFPMLVEPASCSGKPKVLYDSRGFCGEVISMMRACRDKKVRLRREKAQKRELYRYRPSVFYSYHLKDGTLASLVDIPESYSELVQTVGGSNRSVFVVVPALEYRAWLSPTQLFDFYRIYGREEFGGAE